MGALDGGVGVRCWREGQMQDCGVCVHFFMLVVGWATALEVFPVPNNAH